MCFRQLYKLLVRGDADRDTFNDTYIRLTYKYNKNIEFKKQFIYHFNVLKEAYRKDSMNYKMNVQDIHDCENKFTSEEET